MSNIQYFLNFCSCGREKFGSLASSYYNKEGANIAKQYYTAIIQVYNYLKRNLNNNSQGLLKCDLKTITTIISSMPGINKVVVFGSRAKGTQKPGSDIDLAVWSISSDHAMALSGKLNDETLLPYTFDVISYDDISNEALRAHINRVGIIIYP